MRVQVPPSAPNVSNSVGLSPSGKATGFDPVIPRFESWQTCHYFDDVSNQVISKICAEVAKLVDAPDLGSGAARRKSSSLFFRTIIESNDDRRADYCRSVAKR